VNDTVFENNVKSWSGDHCIDPQEVPGVLFCNRKLSFGAPPEIKDVGPTVLSLFGVDVPRYMDGRPFGFVDADGSDVSAESGDSESS